MEWIKTRYEQIKAQVKTFLEKFDKKQKRMVAIGLSAIVLVAVSIAIILNINAYEVLFSNVAAAEATNITQQLQSDGVDYRHNENGDILVPKSIADDLRAELVVAGYPSSGFTYDITIGNASGLTTESQQRLYELYDLQNRIGATVALFDGVEQAVVTINLAEEDRYVLQSDANTNKSSASVTVKLQEGYYLTNEQILGIQRLVSVNVANLAMEDVAVIDGYGIEVSAGIYEDGTSEISADVQEQLKAIENQTASKIVNVLSPFYGQDNIKVAVTGVLSQDKGLSETITYEVPEGLLEENGEGILSQEQGSLSQSTDETTGDVAGTETNADLPQYNADGELIQGNYSETYQRDYLVNQYIEQLEISGYELEDLRVSVSINSTNTNEAINTNQLLDLIGNAAGIQASERVEKITVITAPFYSSGLDSITSGNFFENLSTTQLMIVAGAGIGVLLLLILLLVVVTRSKKKKAQKQKEEEEQQQLIENQSYELENAAKMEAFALQNERSEEVRQGVRDFASENPEISAQMIKNWLNGGESNG